MADVAQPHHDRAHARWSASATAANWACPGRLALVESLNMPDKESEAAAWGTAAHSLSEKCLRSGKDAADFIGTTEKTKEHSFGVDDEMAECAQTYVDYVRVVSGSEGAVLHIEQNFSLAALDPPIESGGTGDAIIWTPSVFELEIVDLKGGRGVLVEAKGNPQLRTYAVGAMLAFADLPVETVRVTIVQPRAAHKDGRIRSEAFAVADLVEWTGELLTRMGLCADAIAEFKAVVSGAVTMAEWAAKWLVPGDHCDKSFCPARAVCPALEQKVLDAAAVWFDDAGPRVSNAPNTLSPEALAERLDIADMIESWVSAVRAYAHARAETGVTIPGYILVDKEGREKWNDAAAEQTAARAAIAAGLADKDVYNAPKMRTPKQVRDALKKAKRNNVAEALLAYSGAPKTGTNLVRSDKTSRPAATPAVERWTDPS